MIFKRFSRLPEEPQVPEQDAAEPKERFTFKVNHRLKLTADQPGGSVTYLSTVQEVHDDIIGISAPVDRGLVVFLKDDTVLSIEVYDTLGVFSFTSRIVGRMSGNLPLLYLMKPKQIKRFQQREYIRTNAYLQTYCWRVGERAGAFPARTECWTRDISAGGACLAMSSMMGEQERIRLHIGFPNPQTLKRDYVEAVGEVRRLIPESYDKSFLTGISFVHIEEKDRQFINEYVRRWERMGV